ncbi:MAG: cupin [Deltaproteobacteria bacterium]|nr:cupin [Deltaproteobacteria bacterium]
MKLFDLAEVVKKCEERGAPYQEFLRVPQLSCGIYQLAAGEKDPQTAHDEDEVYFVLKGRARIRVGSKEKALGPGSILYVQADVEHAFFDIEDDLSLLVFFGSGGPSGAEV